MAEKSHSCAIVQPVRFLDFVKAHWRKVKQAGHLKMYSTKKILKKPTPSTVVSCVVCKKKTFANRWNMDRNKKIDPQLEEM